MLITSCKTDKTKNELNWDYLEITFYNGWTGGSTVRINKDLTLKKCFYRIISEVDSCLCFVDTLSEESYNKINLMIDSLKESQVDSIYEVHCRDCEGIYLRVKYPDKALQISIIGYEEFDNQITRLAKYIYNIPISRNHRDSPEIFETTKFMIPPPIDIKQKFIPPSQYE